ncbi:MAG TPA: DUF3426 domain-containing protein [Gammaproteobacteria bacterium]|nr:DUF3426 domain-containing protein [Gammaproteobacteria bacterium]
MYTQCPSCQTVFRVRAEELRVARGKVRCSQCDEIFDALASLHEGPEAAEHGSLPLFSAPPTPATDLLTGIETPLPAVAPTPAAAEQTATPPVVQEGEPAVDTPPFPPPPQPPYPFEPSAAPSPRYWVWYVLNGLLVLTLVAQAIHAHRDLLSQTPRIGPWLQSAYERLELPLESRRDLKLIDITRTAVTSHADYREVLHLTGVMVNGADFAQPWPLLRVRLEDRWGDIVGIRDFRPEEYLRDANDAASPMKPAQSAAIDLEILDPGGAAVGFAVEPCMPSQNGVMCLADIR